MQANWKAVLAAGTLALSGALGIGATSALAQAVGEAPRATYPGYYYSAGVYSGSVYFSPGYYPIAGTVAGPSVPSYGSSRSAVVRRPRPTVNYYDETTGRNNLPIPLSKPWLRPLR
jgi:hypothetical protein